MKTSKPASLALNLGGGTLCALLLPLPFLWAWLVSISAITFLAMLRDKLSAKWHFTRVPEQTLHALTLIGGTLGLLLGRALFKHKTKKTGFNRWLKAIVVVQLCILGIWYYRVLFGSVRTLF